MIDVQMVIVVIHQRLVDNYDWSSQNVIDIDVLTLKITGGTRRITKRKRKRQIMRLILSLHAFSARCLAEGNIRLCYGCSRNISQKAAAIASEIFCQTERSTVLMLHKLSKKHIRMLRNPHRLPAHEWALRRRCGRRRGLLIGTRR